MKQFVGRYWLPIFLCFLLLAMTTFFDNNFLFLPQLACQFEDSISSQSGCFMNTDNGNIYKLIDSNSFHNHDHQGLRVTHCAVEGYLLMEPDAGFKYEIGQPKRHRYIRLENNRKFLKAVTCPKEYKKDL